MATIDDGGFTYKTDLTGNIKVYENKEPNLSITSKVKKFFGIKPKKQDPVDLAFEALVVLSPILKEGTSVYFQVVDNGNVKLIIQEGNN